MPLKAVEVARDGEFTLIEVVFSVALLLVHLHAYQGCVVDEVMGFETELLLVGCIWRVVWAF